jgi:hypothetical protein
MMNAERRKHKRVAVDFPVVYRLDGKRILGKAVNACNEGLMVESYFGFDAARHLLQNLTTNQEPLVGLQFAYRRRGFRTEGEIRHFCLRFSGAGSFRAELGLFVPKIE